MTFFKRLIQSRTQKTEAEDVMKIVRIIGPLIDKTAIEIMAAHRTELLREPITYIVPAVWGVIKDGELTAAQKEMHREIAPNIKKIYEALELKKVNEAQKFAILDIIRGLVISKVTYMIEAMKNHARSRQQTIYRLPELYDLEPAGRA